MLSMFDIFWLPASKDSKKEPTRISLQLNFLKVFKDSNLYLNRLLCSFINYFAGSKNETRREGNATDMGIQYNYSVVLSTSITP